MYTTCVLLSQNVVQWSKLELGCIDMLATHTCHEIEVVSISKFQCTVTKATWLYIMQSKLNQIREQE